MVFILWSSTNHTPIKYRFLLKKSTWMTSAYLTVFCVVDEQALLVTCRVTWKQLLKHVHFNRSGDMVDDEAHRALIFVESATETWLYNINTNNCMYSGVGLLVLTPVIGPQEHGDSQMPMWMCKGVGEVGQLNNCRKQQKLVGQALYLTYIIFGYVWERLILQLLWNSIMTFCIAYIVGQLFY
jgi:hypothetical protein